ncbi:MAG: transporter [Bacillales bacterium]|nr:transporter [Bacillales bacterium]
MKFLQKYWLKYRKRFLLAIIFLTVEATCDLLQPTIMSHIIDNGVRTRSLRSVLEMSGLMLLVTLIGAAGAIIRSQLASRVSQSFGADLRSDLFQKIHSFSFEEASKHEAASLITRITNDSTQIQNFANGLMRIFVKAPILAIGAFIMVALLSLKLAAILLVVVPLIVLFMYLSLKIAFPYFAKMQQKLDRNNSVIREYLSGIRVVKAFNTFDQEVDRFEKSNSDLAEISIKANRVQVVFMPIITFTVNMAVVFLLWTAQPEILKGTLRIGLIIAFINYIAQILQSLTMIFNVYQMFIRAKASAERVSEILTIEKDQRKGDFPSDKIQGEITFKNVTFSYPNTVGTPILRNINFKINSKETLGIIGSTGSGKTTLVHLILGFFQANAGRILIDNQPIEKYDLDGLRESISIVPQKALLFTGTIVDNIRWGKMDASDEEVVAAAKVAQAHKFIESFQDGYNTWIGQGGVNLSGGQKQRISIARALIRHPKILILDDSVSAVDVETEAAILNGLNQMNKDLTCITISQRISSVMNLPKILVLDEGEMAGFGTHQELLKTCRVYQEICQSQLGKSLIVPSRFQILDNFDTHSSSQIKGLDTSGGGIV